LALSIRFPGLEPGLGRTTTDQALAQLLAMAVTFGMSILVGLVTGLFISITALFDPMDDSELFQDDRFFQITEFMEEDSDDGTSVSGRPSSMDFPKKMSGADSVTKFKINTFIK
jgi:hypothetical protein